MLALARSYCARFSHASDFNRMSALYGADPVMFEVRSSQMRAYPKLMRRYFGAAAVMRRNGLVPFLHAQHSAMRAVPIFLETLAGQAAPKHFKYFRNPSEEFRVARNPLWNKIASSHFEVSSHVLSMSYSIFESEPEESASYFLFSNKSVDSSSAVATGNRVIADYLRRRGVGPETAAILRTIARFQEDYAQLKLGTLYMIGVPEESLERFVYDSEAYGKPTGIDVRQALESYAFAQYHHKTPQARLIFYEETMDPRSGLVVVDITDAEETEDYVEMHGEGSLESLEMFDAFFPDSYSDIEEENQCKQAQIDLEVRLFANSIAKRPSS